ncbi:MAG TPA: exodeoxyribonuclease III [Polyangia bacterium]
MKIATWNVNSIRVRMERVIPWLQEHQPDVLCMQELKVEEEKFPFLELRGLGYHVEIAAQKTYNGVAILSKTPIADVRRGLDDGVEDPQARLIGGVVDGVRIMSVYVPNGQAPGTDKYEYKLQWMDRLVRDLDAHYDRAQPLLICGDFNVAPEDKDVHDPVAWAQETLFHIDARKALDRIRAWGLVDLFRLHHWEAGYYSWWDYQMLGFPKNRGLRIDHIFATEPLARRCDGCWIDREARKGQKPSDHAPVVATFG